MVQLLMTAEDDVKPARQGLKDLVPGILVDAVGCVLRVVDGSVCRTSAKRRGCVQGSIVQGQNNGSQLVHISCLRTYMHESSRIEEKTYFDSE